MEIFIGKKDLNIFEFLKSDCGDKIDKKLFHQRWVKEHHDYDIFDNIPIGVLIDEYGDGCGSEYECFFDWLVSEGYVEHKVINVNFKVNAQELKDFLDEYKDDLLDFEAIKKGFEDAIDVAEGINQKEKPGPKLKPKQKPKPKKK